MANKAVCAWQSQAQQGTAYRTTAFLSVPAHIRVGQYNIIFLRHFLKEAFDSFHLLAADKTHHQEPSNALSHVSFGLAVKKLQSL